MWPVLELDIALSSELVSVVGLTGGTMKMSPPTIGKGHGLECGCRESVKDMLMVLRASYSEIAHPSRTKCASHFLVVLDAQESTAVIAVMGVAPHQQWWQFSGIY